MFLLNLELTNFSKLSAHSQRFLCLRPLIMYSLLPSCYATSYWVIVCHSKAKKNTNKHTDVFADCL